MKSEHSATVPADYSAYSNIGLLPTTPPRLLPPARRVVMLPHQ
jgi:hypothetical protein